jgi:hypothetical protein
LSWWSDDKRRATIVLLAGRGGLLPTEQISQPGANTISGHAAENVASKASSASASRPTKHADDWSRILSIGLQHRLTASIADQSGTRIQVGEVLSRRHVFVKVRR